MQCYESISPGTRSHCHATLLLLASAPYRLRTYLLSLTTPHSWIQSCSNFCKSMCTYPRQGRFCSGTLRSGARRVRYNLLRDPTDHLCCPVRTRCPISSRPGSVSCGGTSRTRVSTQETEQRSLMPARECDHRDGGGRSKARTRRYTQWHRDPGRIAGNGRAGGNERSRSRADFPAPWLWTGGSGGAQV